MKYKKIMFMLVLAVFLLSITCVSASEIDDTLASEDTNTIGLSVDNDIIEDNLQTSEENEALASTDYDEAIAQTDTEVLGADSAKYSDLAEEIGHSGDITLTHKNYTYDEGETITIREAHKVIDGNGAVIDMNGSTIRAFYISASGVTIKNLTIKNANYDGDGGAIYFTSSATSGTVSNCNFVNNSASNGGAVYFSSNGDVTNCNFVNNTASEWGGAIKFSVTGTVSNCNFTNNTATSQGGAIRFSLSGTVTNCNFADNSASSGGAIFSRLWYTTADTCIFIRNSGDDVNTVIYPPTLNVDNFTTVYGSGEKLTFDLKTNSSIPVTNGNISISVYFKGNGEWVRNYTCLSGEGWIPDLPVGSYIAFFDTEYAEFQKINRTITITAPEHTFWFLNYTINGNDNPVIELSHDFYFDPAYDAAFVNGIVINRPVTINGNGNAIDAKRQARIFYVESANAVLENLTIINANYEGYGGAVHFSSTGTVSNCNFADNKATGDYSYGGAIYICSGTVTNCNFTDNTASGDGGAVYFSSTGTVSNCNFTDNTATYYGGAVYIDGTGNVTNCNFTDNTAASDGAINMGSGTVSYCNFTNNTANDGDGAIYFLDQGTVTNCNFTDNTAGYWGGVVYFDGTGTVSNCNFTGNNATTGSAIYFNKWGSSDTLTVSNSTFLNNRANAESLDVVKNDNNITITFTGRNNLLNAIYSRNDAEVAFTNVKYWGANGITTVSSTMSGSNKAAGQNITVGVVVNGKIVLNQVYVTDEDGTIVLNINAGDNYYITARHDTDSYYTEAERTISNNTKFSVNVTSQTTTNKTVNITAKSNIPNDVVQGKLLFILPNGTQIDAIYGANGTWWAVHTFDDYGEYNVNASYVGLDNVTVNNGTITINKVNSTIALDNIVLDYGESANVTVTTTGATGITAKIDGNDVAVINNYTIQISGLKAGNHTLTVTTIPDNDHNPVTATSKITVNKVESTLTVDDIVFDYEGEGSCDVSFTGASEVNANVVNQPSAVVNVNGNKITVSGLAAGTYTLNVTTVPDENHTAVTETATITVNKVNSTLTLDNVELDYGETKNITVTAEGATGITAKIDGVNVTVNGYTIPISGLSAGNYTLTVTTIPDDNHNPITKEATITVNKLSTEITLANETLDLKVNDEFAVFADLTPDGAGNLTYSSSNESVVKVSDVGLITALGNGTSTVTVSFAGNDNYTAAQNKTIAVTVTLNDASVSAEDITLDVGANAIVDVTVVPDGLDVTYVPDNSGVVTIENGVVTAVKEGTAKITLTVGGDGVYALNSTIITVTVNKIDTSIDVDQSSLNLEVGDDSSISATLTPADAGNVTFISSDNKVVTVDDKGNVKAVGEGKANIIVSFAGDDKYNAAENKTVTVTVSLKDASVSAEDITLDVGANATIDAVSVPDDLEVTYISDNSGVVTVENGVVTAVKGGTATVTLTVGGDGVYALNSTTITVTVNKLNATADVSLPENINVGDNSTVNVVLHSDATGNVTVKVDGKVVDTVPVKDGSADVIIPSMTAGKHTVEIDYTGDGKYNPLNETQKISVSKKDVTPEITIPSDITFGDDATVDVKLPSDAKGNVTLNVDGKVIDTVPVVNGAASVKLPSLNAGNHTAEITYSGDDKYNSVSKTATISVGKDSTNLSAANVTATYKVNKYLVIKLTDSHGNPLTNSTVTVDLNGAKNYTSDENGQVKVKVSNKAPKTYTAKITFAGNNNYLGSEATAKVVVKKATPKITAKAKTFKTTTKTKKYTITLKDNTGKAIKNAKVALKVNGKTYKATTNSKGKATFKITKLTKKGTFKATVTYKGNKYFKKVTKKVNIKVKSVWKTVQKGSKKKAIVKKIQRALKKHGYYLTYNGHYLKVDGIFWGYTKMAVKQFQNTKKLKVTGKVDEKTAKKLGLI